MITLQDVEESLAELENAPGTFDTAYKMATLLQLREYLSGGGHTAQPDIPAESEFLQLALSRDPALVWPLLDEMMEATAVLLPRMYDAVMRQLREM